MELTFVNDLPKWIRHSKIIIKIVDLWALIEGNEIILVTTQLARLDQHIRLV